MNTSAHQLNLFQSSSLNPTYEIKRQLRLALAKSILSRDEVVDRMNEISVREGMRKTISKASLDNWTKDSDPGRLPSLPQLTIFCSVLDTVTPLAAMIRPLEGDIINKEDARLLMWARAEREKKQAAKRARLAEQSLGDF